MPDTVGVHRAGGQGASEAAGVARAQMQQDLALALVYSGAPDAVEEAHSLVQESLSTTTVRGAPPGHARPQRRSPGARWAPDSQRLFCACCAAGAQTGCRCTVVRGLPLCARAYGSQPHGLVPWQSFDQQQGSKYLDNLCVHVDSRFAGTRERCTHQAACAGSGLAHAAARRSAPAAACSGTSRARLRCG